MSLPNVVMLVLGPHGAVALYAPEQEHTQDCNEEDSCKCPVAGYEVVARRTIKTQMCREDIVAEAVELGSRDHVCDEDEEDCGCDLSPLLPVWFIAETGHPDLVEWGRWLAALDMADAPVKQKLVEPQTWRTAVSDSEKPATLKELRRILKGPPLSEAQTICAGLALWAQRFV